MQGDLIRSSHGEDVSVRCGARTHSTPRSYTAQARLVLAGGHGGLRAPGLASLVAIQPPSSSALFKFVVCELCITLSMQFYVYFKGACAASAAASTRERRRAGRRRRARRRARRRWRWWTRWYRRCRQRRHWRGWRRRRAGRRLRRARRARWRALQHAAHGVCVGQRATCKRHQPAAVRHTKRPAWRRRAREDGHRRHIARRCY